MISSCNQNPLSPGVEYMPDMYRSPSLETYVDYNYPDSSFSRMPVKGTIPFSKDPKKAYINMPYPYPNTNEGYEAAGMNLKNPIPCDEKVIEQGKVLYTKFCVHCHGESGAGDGSMVKNDKFPTPGSYSEKFKDINEGKMFHSIHYGKGLMGSHASQLTKEERWKIIHFVQKLQKGSSCATAMVDSTAQAKMKKK